MRLVNLAVALCLALAACMSAEGGSEREQRQAVQQMRSDSLAKLYRIEPGARAQVEGAAGYGVFSNVGVNLILMSAASGWGVVRDRRTGQDIYMKMISGGLGLGLGVKDFRGVFVFTSADALRQFVEGGWDASAQVDAAAKSGDKGDAFAGAVDVAPGVKLSRSPSTAWRSRPPFRAPSSGKSALN